MKLSRFLSTESALAVLGSRLSGCTVQGALCPHDPNIFSRFDASKNQSENANKFRRSYLGLRFGFAVGDVYLVISPSYRFGGDFRSGIDDF